MYINEQVSIGKTEDGNYILSFRVQKKRDMTSKGEIMAGSEEKTHVATSMQDLFSQLKKVLPKLQEGRLEQQDYDEAFEEASQS